MAPPLTRRRKKLALAAAPAPSPVVDPAARRLSKLPEEIQAQVLPLTSRRKKLALAAAPAPHPVLDPTDRLSRLPEEILAQVLSFLPAQEAVRTCVLARTWRHVWKSTRRLLVTAQSVREVRGFVDCLMLCVHLEGLDGFEIRIDPVPDGQDADFYNFEVSPYLEAEDTSSLIRWICRVLECQIQMLRVDISTYGYYRAYLRMSDDWHLVSRHLTRLELKGIKFDCGCLNLDGCPALGHLEIKSCDWGVMSKMTSSSLKRLVITSNKSTCDRVHPPQICVPHLDSLFLEAWPYTTPQLERMLELVEAKFKITACVDYHLLCADYDSAEEDSIDYSYHGKIITKCVVLEGLAEATDLVLIAHNSTCIFRMDLRWCPIFFKLKTLVLNDYWCKSADCSTLACILEHTPVLHKFTVLFSGRETEDSDLLKYGVVVEGRPDATGTSTMISQHLQIVEVKCFEVHQRVLDVLKFLGTFGIWFQFRVTEGSKPR